MKSALIFPGQGSQTIGMAKDFYETFAESRHAFEEAADATRLNIKRLCFDGPTDELTLTENLQPCLLTASIAMFRALPHEMDLDVSYFAGHSLGEYSALVAAGSLSLYDAAKLTQARGAAMQKAVRPKAGAMAAVLGLTTQDVSALCAEAARVTGEVVQIANDNAPGQIVISGTSDAVAKASALAATLATTDERYRKAKFISLNVSAPFHCALMKPAQDELKPLLLKTTFKAPTHPVLLNITAQPNSNAVEFPAALCDQITGMVRWRESMEKLPHLHTHAALEVGPGAVLTGLLKRINKEIKCTPINSVAALKALKGGA